jgi:hypothetical protein
MNKEEKGKIVYNIYIHYLEYFIAHARPTGQNGCLELSNDVINKWMRLLETNFDNLTKKEKEINYRIADKYLKNL